MRIAMIGSRGIPAGTGGVERVVEELTVELTARGHEVLVYSRPWYLRQRAGAAAPAGRVIATAGLTGKHADAITHTATAMWDVLRRDVDVIHIHAAGPALMSWLPAMARIPVLLTVHSPDWQRRRWSRAARMMVRAGLAMGMKLSAVVSTVSLSLRDYLADTYHREVLWIPNGVRPVSPIKPAAIARWGLEGDSYALHVGRIVPEKRLDLLVRAWRQAAPPMRLVVAGDDLQDAAFAAACRREADESVLFVGPQHGHVLAELYSNAAMVIQPSELEGMPLVLLEAAGYGRCVIARDMPANREALGDAMAPVADASEGALAEGIMKCVRDRKYRTELGQAAARLVAEKFRWSDIAAKYEQAYLRSTGQR